MHNMLVKFCMQASYYRGAQYNVWIVTWIRIVSTNSGYLCIDQR